MATDSLTGMLDKQSFVRKLEERFKTKEPFVLVRVDIIHLKSVNERYGHIGGDKVIRETGERLLRYDSSLEVYRTNPVSYTLITPKEINLNELFGVLSEPVVMEKESVVPKVRLFSLVTKKSDTERSVTTLFKHASSKYELLRERIVVIDEALRREALSEDTLLKEILTAIEKESFFVVYQPVLDMQSGKMISAEALTRLISTKGEFIHPGLLFEYAEEKRLNSAITNIVLKKVCKFLGEHQELNIGSVSVNMTPDEILDSKLPEKLKEVTEAYGVKLNQLRLEMTERTIQKSPEEIARIMEKLQDMGTGFYLDDFGTGYSNLSSLITMPFECIKLDKSLIDMLEEEDKAKMVALISEMIHIGKARIIAEGVETKKQMDFIRENHIDRVQGYGYSRPLKEDDFVTFTKEHTEVKG